MCFHTSQTKKTVELEHRFDATLVDDAMRDYFDVPRYHLHGFAHPNMLVIPQEQSNVLAPGIWGIVPHYKTKDDIKPYYKEAVKYGGGLNARSEKVFQHFIYRDSIMDNRCIIPVSGFYEPHDYKGTKYPFHFKAKDEQPLALAGLYTVIDTFITFTILTKAASPLFAKIHNKKNRQPVILSEDNMHNWLSTDLSESDIKELLHFNFPEEQLDAYAISRDLFSTKVHSDTPTILEKVEYEELDF
jgi:putative SOS response-associated peptidase YedK